MGVAEFNAKVANSWFGRYFKLDKRRTNFMTEIRAGLTTFVTMAYIISVNAVIVSDSGGPCVCAAGQGQCTKPGLDKAYDQCVFNLKQDLVVATTAAALIGSFLMGGFANMPIGVACAMGVNAYFTYGIVGYRGTGTVTYQQALACVFIEGLIFVALSLLGIRQFLVKLIPPSLKTAMGVGIGLFLCFIGFQSSAGIGLVTNDPATLVTLGGCPLSAHDATGTCEPGTNMTGATTWLGILGFVLVGILSCYGVPGAILVGVALVSIISWPRNTPFTLFPNTPQGDEAFNVFKQVVAVPQINSTLWVLDFNFAANPNAWVALFTMLYLNIFDTTGALYAMAGFAGMLNKRGDFDGSDKAFIADALSITIGSIFGVPPCATFLESAAGIAEGGRTGITGLVVSFCFFIALFFSPILGNIPPWATGPALIYVGSLMASGVRDINWDYPGDSIPAFINIALMPLTYSVAYGIIGGLGVWIVINVPIDILRWITKNKWTPDITKREPRPAIREMSFVQPWMKWVYCKIKKIPYEPEDFDVPPPPVDSSVESIAEMGINDKEGVPISNQISTNATLLHSKDQVDVHPDNLQPTPTPFTLSASGNFTQGGPQEYPHYAEGEVHLRAYDAVNQAYSHFERAGAAGNQSNLSGV